jgi:hypothetical protein
MLKRAFAFLLLLTVGACGGGNSTTTSPSPTATPTPTPTTTFSLSGQVTDSMTGIGISGATVSIAPSFSPDAGKSTTTGNSGNYSLTGLQPSGFTVIVSASNYASRSQIVTLASDQTLSFQLIVRADVITFDGLTVDGVCPATPSPSPSCAVRTYSESGFTVLATSGDWFVRSDYGNPAPFIQFWATAGSTVTDTIQVTAGGATFGFKSVDLYSSTTPIPYTITGLRNSTTTFIVAATLPNPQGNFATVVNPQADVIDTLVVSLSNAAALAQCPTCANPMGLDNIVVTH